MQNERPGCDGGRAFVSSISIVAVWGEILGQLFLRFCAQHAFHLLHNRIWLLI